MIRPLAVVAVLLACAVAGPPAAVAPAAATCPSSLTLHRLQAALDAAAPSDPRAAALRDHIRTRAPSGVCPPATAAPAGPLDLSVWALQLPTGTPGNPDVIAPAHLPTYTSTWFHPTAQRSGLTLTSPVAGVTTKGSQYPRTELREMTPTGGKASWSNTAGTHTMTVRQAVTALPTVKPQVVTAQILAGSDNVLQIRLEGGVLLARTGTGERATLDPHYRLATPYEIAISAFNGRVTVSFNGSPKLDAALAGQNWYFKTGSYIQSNTDLGEAPNAVATVEIYDLAVAHTT